MLLDVKHIKKVYRTRGNETIALRDVDFGVKEGEFVAIMGESGSGKTTLLNITATFDEPTEGKIELNGQDLSKIPSKQIAQFRREELGFVFQDFNVLDTFNNKDNILLPLVLSDVPKHEMEKRLDEVSAFVGIESLLNKYPYEISGGQRQRIAIARALINQPKLLLADEPTGNLDSATSSQILDVLRSVNEAGNTIMMVTHSVKAASEAARVLFIKDGKIFHEVYRGKADSQAFQERIAESLSVLNEAAEEAAGTPRPARPATRPRCSPAIPTPGRPADGARPSRFRECGRPTAIMWSSTTSRSTCPTDRSSVSSGRMARARPRRCGCSWASRAPTPASSSTTERSGTCRTCPRSTRG